MQRGRNRARRALLRHSRPARPRVCPGGRLKPQSSPTGTASARRSTSSSAAIPSEMSTISHTPHLCSGETPGAFQRRRRWRRSRCATLIQRPAPNSSTPTPIPQRRSKPVKGSALALAGSTPACGPGGGSGSVSGLAALSVWAVSGTWCGSTSGFAPSTDDSDLDSGSGFGFGGSTSGFGSPSGSGVFGVGGGVV